MLGHVDAFGLSVAPMIIDTDGVRVYPDRNEEWIEHVKRLQATDKLELIQVSHILGLNVLIFVGEFSICILSAVMLCRAENIRESYCGCRMVPTIVARTLIATFILRTDNLSH